MTSSSARGRTVELNDKSDAMRHGLDESLVARSAVSMAGLVSAGMADDVAAVVSGTL